MAYEVCAHSIRRHASAPVEIIPLKQEELRRQGLYDRPRDPLASTEFTYTRFLVPSLSGYQGWALFVDSDFLFTSDIFELQPYLNNSFAVCCVQRTYQPNEKTKMDGCVQTVYPRKNWSSFVLWNNAHPKNKKMTPAAVSQESPAFLHRFKWLEDQEIGALPETWNWLEGWSLKENGTLPKAIHYTRGGPWFENWRHVDFADLWNAERSLLEQVSSKENYLKK